MLVFETRSSARSVAKHERSVQGIDRVSEERSQTRSRHELWYKRVNDWLEEEVSAATDTGRLSNKKNKSQ